jgi:hypothetical protein
MNTIRAIVRSGKIEFLDPVDVPEGTEVLVIVPASADNKFWLAVSERSLETIWDNPEDNVYEQLLKV